MSGTASRGTAGPSDASDSVAGLLLAAGGGLRLGRPKALVQFQGEQLVERGVRLLTQAGCQPIVVVLGAAAPDVRSQSALGTAQVVVNEAWETGMASSLRAGLRSLEQSGSDACIVALVDQPLVTAEALRRLIAAWEAGAVAAAAAYRGQPRNPVLFDRRVWRDVSDAAVGDEGARGWIHSNVNLVRLVPCDDVASSADIDTEADLRTLSGQPGDEAAAFPETPPT